MEVTKFMESEFMSSLQSTLGTHVPAIIGAILILIVGWFVAVVVRAGTRKSLSLLKVNQRISETTEEKLDVEKGVGVGVFWFVHMMTPVLNHFIIDCNTTIAPLSTRPIFPMHLMTRVWHV